MLARWSNNKWGVDMINLASISLFSLTPMTLKLAQPIETLYVEIN